MDQTCFVIQPFDREHYDKLYKETYKPAISYAGFEPYRVDEDLSASIPIEQIEKGIRDSALCFAEITEDNPNVWFELGMAIAFSKDVCLVCNEKRVKFPFDVQHRHIIRYSTSVPSDFDLLKNQIQERLVAIGKKQESISTLSRAIVAEPKSPDDLSNFEIACLGAIASNSASQFEAITFFNLRREMSQSGYTNIATNVAVQALLRRGFISLRVETDYNESYEVVVMEQSGWSWLEKNISHFALRNEVPF